MDIISLYSTTVTYLTSKAIEFGEKRKIRAITPLKVIEVGTVICSRRSSLCDTQVDAEGGDCAHGRMKQWRIHNATRPKGGSSHVRELYIERSLWKPWL